MANSLSTRHRNSVYFFSFLLLALAAYVSWWNDAKGKKSAASKDPLEKTIYMWH
ncbi:MAG: hypothetical protein J5478_05835 [Bacteroidales bacterium]|nr:hypothetical protein [Bacteroidales bacterium]